VLSLLGILQRDIGRNDMCFGSGKKKVKPAEEIYQEKKKDYGPLPSLSMGDPISQIESMKDVPQMRSTGMTTRSLLKVNY